jgi:hypothetical protein
MEDGSEFFAHVKDYLNREAMQVGKRVSFTPVPTTMPGKTPIAMDVAELAA